MCGFLHKHLSFLFVFVHLYILLLFVCLWCNCCFWWLLILVAAWPSFDPPLYVCMCVCLCEWGLLYCTELRTFYTIEHAAGWYSLHRGGGNGGFSTYHQRACYYCTCTIVFCYLVLLFRLNLDTHTNNSPSTSSSSTSSSTHKHTHTHTHFKDGC